MRKLVILSIFLFHVALSALASLSGPEKQESGSERFVRPLCSHPRIAAHGESRFPVLLVEFCDVEFEDKADALWFDEFFNAPEGVNKNRRGSVGSWFSDNSKGLFNPKFDIYGPVKLPMNSTYYGAKDRFGRDVHLLEMVEEACVKLLQDIDLQVYDSDGDMLIDNIFIMFAGQARKDNAPYSGISARIGSMKEEGEMCRVGNYAVDSFSLHNEKSGKYFFEGIGKVVKAFAHLLGLPSLARPDEEYQITTPGTWSVIDMGYLNGSGNCPPFFSAPERYALGWLSPTVADFEGEVRLSPAARSGDALLIPTLRDEEYFMVEFRDGSSWDEALPGRGLLVGHIDYAPRAWDEDVINVDLTHPRWTLVKANGVESYDALSSVASQITGGWCFPGLAGVTDLLYNGIPSFTDSDLRPLQYEIRN
ncbi:MAG: hypothetical protein K2G23_08750, partial [Muribaculaceae bacterium]|nr:hypothetical protein [Muribaculaceae bacterium]